MNFWQWQDCLWPVTMQHVGISLKSMQHCERHVWSTFLQQMLHSARCCSGPFVFLKLLSAWKWPWYSLSSCTKQWNSPCCLLRVRMENTYILFMSCLMWICVVLLIHLGNVPSCCFVYWHRSWCVKTFSVTQLAQQKDTDVTTTTTNSGSVPFKCPITRTLQQKLLNVCFFLLSKCFAYEKRFTFTCSTGPYIETQTWTTHLEWQTCLSAKYLLTFLNDCRVIRWRFIQCVNTCN